eukprot:gene2241-2022_t
MPRVIANYLEHVKSGIRLSTGTPVIDLMLPAFVRSLKKDVRNRPIKRAYAILKVETDHLVDSLVAEGLLHVAAFAALAWTTAGRLSDIMHTRSIRVSWFQVKDDPQQVKPDWMGSLGRWTHLVLDQIGRSSAAKLFPGAASLYLKEVQARVPKATGHSFKRGAVQHLATDLNLEQLIYYPHVSGGDEAQCPRDVGDPAGLTTPVKGVEDSRLLAARDIALNPLHKPSSFGRGGGGNNNNYNNFVKMPLGPYPEELDEDEELPLVSQVVEGSEYGEHVSFGPKWNPPCHAPLASISSNVQDIDALAETFPSLKPIKDFLEDGLLRTLGIPRTSAIINRVKPSLLLEEDVDMLITNNIIRERRPREQILAEIPAFKVPKKDAVTSRLILDAGPGVDVYLDNFFDFGNLIEADKSFQKQRSLFSNFHMEIKEAETQPVSDKGEVLGMEFDLSKRIHRLAPAWHQKFRTLMRNFSWEQRMTLRDLWSHAQSMFWGLRVLQVPLCRLFRLLQQLRCFAKELQQGKKDWDTWIRLKPASIKEAVEGTKLVQSNQWVYHPLVGSRQNVQVWSDASDIGWGAIVDGRAFGGRWTDRQAQEHINVREAWAAKYALQLALKLVPPHEALVYLCLIDNDTLVRAMKNGRCKNFLINAVVDWFWAASWGWEASWVSTKDQLADYPSRNP